MLDILFTNPPVESFQARKTVLFNIVSFLLRNFPKKLSLMRLELSLLSEKKHLELARATSFATGRKKRELYI